MRSIRLELLRRSLTVSARLLACILVVLLRSTGALGETLVLPPSGDTVVGAVGLASTAYEDTLSDLARAYDQGFWEMRLANPNVDPWLPGVDTELLVPSSYILPDAPREGIVINVPEMRLYHYPESKQPDSARVVATYPISIGRQDWSTPHKETKIIGKKADPTWYPPASIRKEHAENGDPLPKVVRPGPDNPLGRYALRLGVPGYLIHGTNKPYGVGMRVTHGCIRLYPENIERLFNDIAVGTSVRIVNQPFKVGWLNGVLHLEIHPYLAEDEDKFRDQHARIVEKIIEKSRGIPYEIDWNALGAAITAANGIPTSIGRRKAASLTSVSEDLILRATSQW